MECLQGFLHGGSLADERNVIYISKIFNRRTAGHSPINFAQYEVCQEVTEHRTGENSTVPAAKCSHMICDQFIAQLPKSVRKLACFTLQLPCNRCDSGFYRRIEALDIYVLYDAILDIITSACNLPVSFTDTAHVMFENASPA